MLWDAFLFISLWLQNVINSNIYQQMNVLFHFGIFYSVLLNRSVMLWNAFRIIALWLQNMIYSNIYEKMIALSHFAYFLQCSSEQVCHALECVL